MIDSFQRRAPSQILVLLLLTVSAGCARSSGVTWTHSLSEAMKSSRGEKLIITDLYTDWCGWCKVMDARTWADPRVGQERDRFVFLKLNAETEPDGIAMRERFDVSGFPTVMLLNPDGSEFDRLEGYLTAEEFLSRLKQKIDDPDTLGNLIAGEKSDSGNVSLHFKVGRKLMTRGAYKEAQSRFELVASQDPSNKAKLTDSALFFLALCQATQDKTDTSLATIERLRRTYPDSEMIPEARLLDAEILMHAGRTDEAKVQIKDFLKAYPHHRLASRARRLLE